MLSPFKESGCTHVEYEYNNWLRSTRRNNEPDTGSRGQPGAVENLLC